jgi:group II intron reverse transcriptase/maturase
MSRIDRSQPVIAGLVGLEAVHPLAAMSGRSDLSAGTDGRDVEPSLWDQFLDPQNLSAALNRVRANRGAAGVDGVSTDDIRSWLAENWSQVRHALDEGTYRPSPVRRVVIPKPGGGERLLGVPTVLDRLIQQGLAQVLARVFEPGFSPSSFGFRPGRGAHQAVAAAKGFIEDGYSWVVDVDLDKFFDRVNHDALMARVARKVTDKRVLRLVRRFIEADVMVDGVKQAVAEGTPQGSPLSPLLSNIMLDDLDQELTSRGLRFVRYADDIRVFVRSERAADRVLDGITHFVQEKLKLRVNRDKSAARFVVGATFLGFAFSITLTGLVQVRVAPKAIDRLKGRIRTLTGRSWGVSMAYRLEALTRFIRGWIAYFRIADAAHTLRKLDEWLRRRIRQVLWKQWKRPRTKISMLMRLGVPRDKAIQWGTTSKAYWAVARTPILNWTLTNSYLASIGVPSLLHQWQRFRPTA